MDRINKEAGVDGNGEIEEERSLERLRGKER